MSNRLAGAITVAIPLLLAGCATVPTPAPDAGGQPSASAQRPFHQSIDIGGRLSVRYRANGKEEALHGSFTWSQNPEQTTVTLLSPLGQTMAVIQASAEGATLRQGGQQVRSAPDVDALTAETLGWPLPVSGLREWLQGFAIDDTGQRFITSPSAARATLQDGWHIHYTGWIDDNALSTPNRPKRIDLARSTEQAGDVTLRIVIDTWQPH